MPVKMTRQWRFYHAAEALRILRDLRAARGLTGPDTLAAQVAAMSDEQIADIVHLAHRKWDWRTRRYYTDYAWLHEAQRKHLTPSL